MSNQQSDGGSHDFVLTLMVLGAVVAVVTYFFGVYFVEALLWVRLGIVRAFEFLPWIGDLEVLKRADFAISSVTAKEWTGHSLAQLSGQLRWFLFFPFATIFVWYAYRVWGKNPANSFRRIHTRETLLLSEVRNWPWVAPILGLDLIKASILEGPWAMSKKPLDFARHYKLLDDGKTLNRKRAEKVFASQLGALWESPDRLPRYSKALFACFIAQACHNKDGARDGLKALALGMADKKVDYSWVDGLIKKHIEDERVLAILKCSAYSTTILCAALRAARVNGVLPPNYFLWLRPVNRSLWYALNGVGRRTPFCEVAGIHAHMLAEEVATHAIERPYVIKAVDALDIALKEVVF